MVFKRLRHSLASGLMKLGKRIEKRGRPKSLGRGYDLQRHALRIGGKEFRESYFLEGSLRKNEKGEYYTEAEETPQEVIDEHDLPYYTDREKGKIFIKKKTLPELVSEMKDHLSTGKDPEELKRNMQGLFTLAYKPSRAKELVDTTISPILDRHSTVGELSLTAEEESKLQKALDDMNDSTRFHEERHLLEALEGRLTPMKPTHKHIKSWLEEEVVAEYYAGLKMKEYEGEMNEEDVDRLRKAMIHGVEGQGSELESYMYMLKPPKMTEEDFAKKIKVDQIKDHILGKIDTLQEAHNKGLSFDEIRKLIYS